MAKSTNKTTDSSTVKKGAEKMPKGSLRAASFASAFTVSMVALLGILVLVNVLVYREGSDWRVDTTEGQQFSLSEQTKQIVGALEEDVRVLAFFGQDHPEFASVASLLEEYRANADGRLSFEFIDPVRQLGLAQQYQVTIPGTLVFVLGERQESVIGSTETDLTRGLVKLTRTEEKSVVFVTGHGEKDPTSEGYTIAGSLLEGDAYTVDTVTLLTDDIPEETDVLVIAGPRQRFAGDEVEKVRAYVETGGRLLLMIDPYSETGIRFTEFDDLLREQFGVERQEGVVVSPNRSLSIDVLSPVIPESEWGVHKLTEGLGDLFLSGASGVTAADASAEGYRVTSLASSEANAWLEVDLDAEAEDLRQTLQQGENDISGPISLGVAVEPIVNEGEDVATKSRLVVLGDSDYATDVLLSQINPRNVELLLNAVNWLADEEDLIAIRPKEQSDRLISLTAEQQRWIGVVSWVLLPSVVILLGVLSWGRRRSRSRA